MFHLLLSALLLAQSPPPQDSQARFSSRSDLVVLHVSVFDSNDSFVPGLPRDAFAIYEDRRPRRIEFFENADSPVTVGLVIDSSISMHRNRAGVIAAATSFADASNPQDEMFTINFNEDVWPGLPRDQPFTSDRDELKRALLRAGTRGRTALFDALRTSLEHLQRGRRQKKVLIVISDGGDNASTTRFEDVLATALRMSAVIYTISIYDEHNREGDKDVLRKLAAVTGGDAFFARHVKEASSILGRIARDLRSSYTIGYVPAGHHEGYRKVRVTVNATDRGKLRVRARSGYVSGDREEGR